MKCKTHITIFLVIVTLAPAGTAQVNWQRSPASDVDKEFISLDPGLIPGVPSTDNSCWLATASNMLAGAGYGQGATIQLRAEDIYFDMITWQAATTIANAHGVEYGGWTDNAVNWWLGSANNTQAGTNPYTVVTVYGNTEKIPWANPNGAKYIGNQLRDYQSVGLSISKPKTATKAASGGHAITAWGDSGSAAVLAANPARVIVADSDRDVGGDFQTYTYDNYANPNPGKFNEGSGWYFNYGNNHWFIKHIVTLCPTDSPVDPNDGPTQKVVGSYTIHQDDLESATDLHYNAYTDSDILGYRTEIDWPTNNAPGITESNRHNPSLTRDTIQVGWDLSDNPVPYCTYVTITTEFILQNWNGIWYEGVYFTYPRDEMSKWLQSPYEDSSGTDIRVDDTDGTDRHLADDFECDSEGRIIKVHLWGSWKDDSGTGPAPGTVQTFHLSIYSDDPVGSVNDLDPNSSDPNNTFSKPLHLLWSDDFNDFNVIDYNFVSGEKFWDPYTGAPLGSDNRIWHFIIDIPEVNAFMQAGSPNEPIIYWLGVSADVNAGDPQFGWKTTEPIDGWNDAAVIWDNNEWNDLSYPSGHPLAFQQVDMAFGIVTRTPDWGAFPPPSFGWEIATPELNDTNVLDITGGYVVGAFDVYDWAGEPNLLGQYRLIHQYPYTQDPEYHTFTIHGPNEMTGCNNYRATNFRFGHSYGMLNSESLRQFYEWMTTSEESVTLCAGEERSITIDWEGRLPYPESDITPAEEMPDSPECTVYEQADFNRDCCVDFEDFGEFANRWLQCTMAD